MSAQEYDDQNQHAIDQLINELASRGRTASAIGEAARWGRFELLTELLESGVAIDARDEHGCTALMLAASGGQTKIVEYLVNRGADVNAMCARNGMTPLIACLAAHHSKRIYKAVCTALLAAGASRSLGIRDMDGRTALDWAKDGRPTEVVALIEQYCAATSSPLPSDDMRPRSVDRIEHVPQLGAVGMEPIDSDKYLATAIGFDHAIYALVKEVAGGALERLMATTEDYEVHEADGLSVAVEREDVERVMGELQNNGYLRDCPSAQA